MPMSWALIGREHVPFRLVPIRGQYAAARRHDESTVLSSLNPHSSAHKLQSPIDGPVATCEVYSQFWGLIRRQAASKVGHFICLKPRTQHRRLPHSNTSLAHPLANCAIPGTSGQTDTSVPHYLLPNHNAPRPPLANHHS